MSAEEMSKEVDKSRVASRQVKRHSGLTWDLWTTSRLTFALVLAAFTLATIPGALLRAVDNTTAAPSPPDVYDEITVKPRTVELRTNAAGSIQPKNRTVVPAPITGKVEWVIEEGSLVKKNTEVARVDCTERTENLEQFKLELSVVEAELKRAKLEAQLVQESLDFEVKKAVLQLELARLRRSVLGPPLQTDVELSLLTVEQTKFAVDAAQREYERLKRLGEKGVESGRKVALAKLNHERTRADYLKAQADHELLLKGDPVEDIAVADEEVKRAEVTLVLAKQRQKSQAAFQATQVRVAEVAVERTRVLMALQQDRIDSSRVTASVDGVVLYPRMWGMPLREGDPVWQSNRLLDIADPSVMSVEAVINQVDWPRVKPGQKVEVRLVAYPGKLLHGTVVSVGKLARDRSLILREDLANVMSLHIVVDVEERASELRPSYTANISIITDRFDSAIAVPRGAVVRHAGRDFLWVKEDNAAVFRPVTLGSSDATNVVVEKGLRLGDRVLLARKKVSESP